MKSETISSKPVEVGDISTGEKTVEVLHPSTDEKIGIRLTLMSATDERLKPIKRAIQNRNLKLQQSRKTIKASEVEDNENSLLAATVVGWDWYDAVFKGEKPEFSPHMVKKIIKELPWFRSFINDEIEDDADFFST